MLTEQIRDETRKERIMQQHKPLMLTALLVLVLAACAQPTPVPTPTLQPPTATPVPTRPAPTLPPQDDSWQKVLDAGVLRVGTSADYPPFEYYNDQFQLDGFDIALIQALGEQLGLKVELNDFAFDGLPAAVAIDQVDLAIAALSVTPARLAIANFSNIYYTGKDAVLTRPDADPAKLKDAQALAAVRLGVQTQTVYEKYAQEQLIETGVMPKQNLYVFTDITQAVDDLKARRIDAVWLDLKPAQSFAAGGDIKVLAQDLNDQLFAIAMQRDSNTLRDKINEALAELEQDGALAKLRQEYLGLEPDEVEPPPPLPPTPIAPQPTPVPPACLDGAQWVADLSFDDKNMTAPPVLNPGQPFTKGWRMRNSGTCTWTTGYALAYTSGNVPAAQMGGQPIPVTRDVRPGETFDFQVNLIAPIAPGTYQGFWNMRNAQNQRFGETVWVGITVRGAATATPAPTQTPVPNISFTANPTSITAGQAVLFQWAVENVRAVFFFHEGQDWRNHGVAGVGQSTEYPPRTMDYYLRVVQRDDSVIVRTIRITVAPAPNAPVINNLSATPPQITLGQCVIVDWSVSGQVTRVALLIDNAPVWDGAPITGNYQDCPVAAGTRIYTLQAFGPGGNATQQVSVNVQNIPPTATPVPQQPTATPVPPTATPVPTTPAPQPPVIQNFTVAPTNIEQDQCVTASWTTGGGTTRVQLLRDGAAIWDNAPLNSSVQDCPPNAAPATINYTLVAYNNAGQQDERAVQVQVAAAPPQNPLANTTWQLQTTEVSGVVPQGVSVTAYFGADGNLSGNGGCNSYNTSYVVNGQAITIQPLVSGMVLCGDPADGVEQTYFRLLSQAATFEISGEQLIIRNSGGQEILRYTRIG
jgi:ABC-type amino acid transport substrate-binding protein/heat shock protein HslJ